MDKDIREKLDEKTMEWFKKWWWVIILGLTGLFIFMEIADGGVFWRS